MKQVGKNSICHASNFQEAPALGFDNLILPALIFFGGALVALLLTLAEAAAAGRVPPLQRGKTPRFGKEKAEEWSG